MAKIGQTTVEALHAGSSVYIDLDSSHCNSFARASDTSSESDEAGMKS